MQESLKILFWLAIIDLPLIFVVLQIIAGSSPAGQIAFVTTLTYVFLAGAVALYVAVLARRASPRHLAYAVPVLMLCGLAWLLIVDFRFATRRATKELEHREAAANPWRFNPHETPILSISGGRCRTPQNGRCPICLICPINVYYLSGSVIVSGVLWE